MPRLPLQRKTLHQLFLRDHYRRRRRDAVERIHTEVQLAWPRDEVLERGVLNAPLEDRRLLNPGLDAGEERLAGPVTKADVEDRRARVDDRDLSHLQASWTRAACYSCPPW